MLGVQKCIVLAGSYEAEPFSLSTCHRQTDSLVSHFKAVSFFNVQGSLMDFYRQPILTPNT